MRSTRASSFSASAKSQQRRDAVKTPEPGALPIWADNSQREAAWPDAQSKYDLRAAPARTSAPRRASDDDDAHAGNNAATSQRELGLAVGSAGWRERAAPINNPLRGSGTVGLASAGSGANGVGGARAQTRVIDSSDTDDDSGGEPSTSTAFMLRHNSKPNLAPGAAAPGALATRAFQTSSDSDSGDNRAYPAPARKTVPGGAGYNPNNANAGYANNSKEALNALNKPASDSEEDYLLRDAPV